MGLGLFGTIILDKVTTVALDADYNTEYAEHARFGAKPLLQGVGDSLVEKHLHFEFHVDNGDPVARLDELQAMRAAMKAGVLVMGGMNHGWYVISQIGINNKWLSDDGKPLWITANVTLKEYVNDIKNTNKPVAVVKTNEPINSQNVSPAEQLGQNTNPQITTLAETVTALMQSEALAIELEQQTQMAQTSGLSEEAILQLVKGISINDYVDSSQNAVDGLNRLLSSSSQSVISNTMLADCNSLLAQAKAVKTIFSQADWSDNLPTVIEQVQSVATLGNGLLGQVTADIAKNSAWLVLR